MVTFLKNVNILFWCILLVGNGDGYKILVMFPYSSNSHMNVFMSVTDELVSRGNDVTLVHPIRQLKVRKEIKTIFIPFIEQSKAGFTTNLFSGKKSYFNSPLFIIDEWSVDVCRYIATSKEIHTLLKAGRQFDIVIVNLIVNECALAIASLVGSHVIVFSAGPVPGYIRNPAPMPYSAIPNYLSTLPSRMNFFQRIENTFFYLRDQFIYDYIFVPKYEKILHEHLPQALPIQKSWNEAALLVVNSDPIVVPPRPTVPSVVTIACPHCKTAKPPPKDIQKFVDDSKEGIIIFSLGSVIQAKFLPKELVNSFLGAFARLKQRIIWKYEDETLEVPINVKIMKWMPQQDILGSPNIRLFITHGGLLSLQEAVYHGVPVLGLPMFFDQVGNLARMKDLGLGERLYFDNLTAHGVYDEIMTIINDKSYRERMQIASKVLKDQDLKGSVKGAYWIEYVARHNGAKHLRTTGEDMPFIQYYLLDVIASVAAMILVSLYVLKIAINKIWKRVSKTKSKHD